MPAGWYEAVSTERVPSEEVLTNPAEAKLANLVIQALLAVKRVVEALSKTEVEEAKREKGEPCSHRAVVVPAVVCCQ